VESEDYLQGSLLGGPKGKLSMYDHGVRTLIIVSWPARLPGRRVVDELVSMLDVVPTLLDYASIPIPEMLSGASLRPLIEGTGGRLHEHLIGASYRLRKLPDRALPEPDKVLSDEDAYYYRSERWHYILYRKRGEEELYDLDADPLEEHNLASDHPDLRRRFRSEIEARQRTLLAPSLRRIGAAKGADRQVVRLARRCLSSLQSPVDCLGKIKRLRRAAERPE
jgi:arylsulfatase A-like enzyme